MALGPGRGLGNEPRTSPQPQSQPRRPAPEAALRRGSHTAARSPAPRPRGLLQMAASGREPRPLGLRPAAASTPGDVGCRGTRTLCSPTSGAAGAPPSQEPRGRVPCGGLAHPAQPLTLTSFLPPPPPLLRPGELQLSLSQPPPLASASGHPGVPGSSADCPLSGPRSPLRQRMLCPGREPGLGVEAKRWVGLTPNPQARAAPGGGRPHGADRMGLTSGRPARPSLAI